MKEPYIKKLEFLYQNTKSKRKIKVTLSNKTVIHIERCHESWEQYGGTTSELWITVPIAEQYNSWLHGESL